MRQQTINLRYSILAVTHSISLITLFAAHRWLSIPYLSKTQGISHERSKEIFETGVLSDIWIAGLSCLVCAIVLLLTHGLAKPFKSRHFKKANTGPSLVPDAIFLLWFIVLATLTVIHQGYVEFFQMQVIPPHIRYLWDIEFLSSTSSSSFSRETLLLLGLSILLLALQIQLFKKTPNSNTQARGLVIYGVILILSLGAHVKSIHDKEQLLIESDLRMNFLEAVVVNLKHFPKRSPISPSEHELLQIHYPEFYLAQTQAELPHADQFVLGETGNFIESEFKNLIKLNQHPIILVVLMESLRPSDSKLYNPNLKQSHTPFLDELFRNQAVYFKRAYASGSVTRAGMESTFCNGYPSSMHTSIMRERRDLKVRCLPSFISKYANSFWYHGGKFGFDNQGNFWKDQGIHDLFTLENAISTDNATSWGLSDHKIFETTLNKLLNYQEPQTRQNEQLLFTVGMTLTMTNHIPWDIPGDLDFDPGQQSLLHPSQISTRYTDKSLELFVRGLKESGLWNRLLLVISSDHGMARGTSQGLYQKNEPEQLLSHIILGLSGGILFPTKDANTSYLSLCKKELLMPREEIVSQQNLGAFLTRLAAPSAGVWNYPLFSKNQNLPVISILEKSVLIPSSDSVIALQDYLNPQGPVTPELSFNRLIFEAAESNSKNASR